MLRVSSVEDNRQKLTRSERRVKKMLIIFEVSDDFAEIKGLLTIL